MELGSSLPHVLGTRGMVGIEACRQLGNGAAERWE